MTDKPAWTTDIIKKSPTLEASYGRAWEIDPRTIHADVHGCIALWLIEAPLAHTLWHSYVLSLVHLAPLSGCAPPVFHLKDATHEIVLFALNPDYPRQAIFDHADWRVMTPCNFAAQFIAEHAAIAAARVSLSVRRIIEGHLSPDSDCRAQWVAMYGSNMIKHA